MSKKLILAIVLVLSGLLASLTSYNSYAVSLSQDVRLISVYNTTFSSTGVDHSFWGVQSGYGPMQSTMFRLNWSNISCKPGDYLETNVNFFNTTENNSLDAWVSSLYGGDNDFSFISATYENMDSSSGQIKFVIYCNTTFTNANKYLEFGSATGAKLNVYTGEYIAVFYTTRYEPVSGLSKDDVIDAINRSNTLNTINNGIAALNDKLDSLNDNEGRVADVAEDEYNQTQEDRQDASSNANGFSFNFSLPNPFSLFEVSDGCVDTPTIDSWLHLEGDWQSPHCPVFPANVRSALTPVLSLLISLACLFVVIRWVSSSSADVANGINTVVKSEKGGK